MQYTDFIRKMNAAGGAGAPVFFAVNYDGSESVVLPPTDAEAQGVLYDFRGATNRAPGDGTHAPLRFEKHPVARQRYRAAFDIVAAHIANGNSYLANLTLPTPVECSLTLREIFLCSRAPYRLLFADRFTVFSPETFVRIAGRRISAHPMKGTIDASMPDAEAIILSDKKETAEHITIVDLLRNDLSMIADRVRVERFRYIDRIETSGKTLLQVSSEIAGDLPDDWRARLGDILGALLPAGSVTGAPKHRTVEILREAEGYARGFYTGIAGYFDGHTLDSCVLIRFLEATPEGLVFKSGGGITCFSDPDSEYQELVDKVEIA